MTLTDLFRPMQIDLYSNSSHPGISDVTQSTIADG